MSWKVNDAVNWRVIWQFLTKLSYSLFWGRVVDASGYGEGLFLALLSGITPIMAQGTIYGARKLI